MCATCGCSDSAGTRINEIGLDERDHRHSDDHGNAGDHTHDHEHGHTHDHGHGHGSGGGTDEHESESGGRTVMLEQDVLAKNDEIAARNREWLESRRIAAVNLMSSPGSGKTTLLERTVLRMGTAGVSVIEGDQETLLDAERMRSTGCRVVQINTGSGCHLDAGMLADGIARLDPPDGSTVLVENVGNLVCPALFDLGQRANVVVMSVTEGADKPLKYPNMFRCADRVLLNKVDLLPYLDFDMSRFLADVYAVNPRIDVHHVSATRGDGMSEWSDWLRTSGVRTE